MFSFPSVRQVSARALALSLVSIISLVSLNGCVSVHYKPTLSLSQSPKTIAASVQIEKFEDLSPDSDRKAKFGGASATEPRALAGDLSIEVTDAILTDFRENMVFQSIKKRIDGTPDLVMKGKIHRFYGKAGSAPLMFLTIPVYFTWFLGLPIFEDYGEIALEVNLERPSGERLASYSETEKFNDWYTIYNYPVYGIGARLNQAFGRCMDKVRKKILDDEALFVRKI